MADDLLVIALATAALPWWFGAVLLATAAVGFGAVVWPGPVAAAPALRVCPQCNGSGQVLVNGELATCGVCGGSGTVRG